METDTIETKPHHGFNVMIKRKRKKMSQDQLADKLKMYQGEISKLESQEVIDEKILVKLAEALECPVAELRDFDIDDAMSTYSVINSNNTNNDTSSSYSGINQTINNTSPELVELYKTVLQEEKESKIREIGAKDKEIAYLREQLANLLNK